MQRYREIVLCDFEYSQPPGESPLVHCMVARECHSGNVHRYWRHQLRRYPPFPIDQECLFVAYAATAELSCFLELGWPMPASTLDLYLAFRATTNGISGGNSLLSALKYYGLPTMEGAEKQQMRELAIRGGPYTSEERKALLDYCEQDVIALARLLPRMWRDIDLPREVIRGRYCEAVARMERVGIPIDQDVYPVLNQHWDEILKDVIGEIDQDYGCYEGTSFRHKRFEALIERLQIPWDRTPTGKLKTDGDTLRDMAKVYPMLGPLKELRCTIGQLRSNDLAIGRDGRNRTAIRPFTARTARNAPSTSKSIINGATWLRHLIKPPPGRALAYVDYSQQEFAIAALRSGDPAMQRAYLSGDPYLATAIEAGFAPEGATKGSHGSIRDQFKVCVLGVQYGLTEFGLSHNLACPLVQAQQLIRAHQRAFPKFWQWKENVMNAGFLEGVISTDCGWPLYVSDDTKPRTLANFPIQAAGAEMLQLACCFITERGVDVCFPVHDAVLIEASLSEIEQAVKVTREAMAEASRIILYGFEVRTDVEIIRYPERMRDKRGERVWQQVVRHLARRDPNLRPLAKSEQASSK